MRGVADGSCCFHVEVQDAKTPAEPHQWTQLNGLTLQRLSMQRSIRLAQYTFEDTRLRISWSWSSVGD